MKTTQFALFFCCLQLLNLNYCLVLPPPIVNSFINALSGSVGTFTVYPLDYIKSNLQTEEGKRKYKNGIDAYLKICKEHGPLAVYDGVWLNIVGMAPEKSIKLSVNDYARDILAIDGHITIVAEAIAGGIAGACQVVVTNPLEVIKVKVQTGMTVQEALEEVKDIPSAYTGVVACAVRDIIFSLILFPIYSHAREGLPALVASMAHGLTLNEFWNGVIAGGLAAFPASIIATPPDFVKTRMQQSRINTGGVNDGSSIVDYSKMSFMEASSLILENEGPAVFFTGCFVRTIRSIPQFAMTLGTANYLHVWVQRNHWV